MNERQAHRLHRHPGMGSRIGRLAATLPGLLLPVLLLAGCGGTATPGDPNGEWTGIPVTDKGSCPTGAASRLMVEGRNISFIPTGGVLVLRGRRPSGDPHLHAQLALTDMNKKPLPMVFEGRLAADGSHIDGTYGTPSCRAHLVLVRPENHPLQRVLGN